jgi:hypothetical protein
LTENPDDFDMLVRKAKTLAEATGRSEEDVLADLMDDGVLNESNKEKRDLVSELKEAAELINTVQAINREVSDNKVLNGNGNSTNVEIETTLEGDIVDRAIESVQRKAENIKKILILISPLFLLLGGGSLEMFGVTNMVGDDDDDTYYEVWGCTDYEAENYDEYATSNDGSCYYPIYGCTNDAAPNYNPNATADDGSCEPNPPPPRPGCTDPEAENYDTNAEQDDGSCTYPPEPVYGCTDDSANNYNSEATEDDGSCEYDPEPECKVGIHNHYRGHVNNDPEADAMVVAFRVVPEDCDGKTIEIDIDLHPPGQDNNVSYHHFVTVDGGEEKDINHIFDDLLPGVWVPRVTVVVDEEQLERVWFWSLEIVKAEEFCEINLYDIAFQTNNTTAVVAYDLDCGTELNDLDGYNVSVQFLVYEQNSTGGVEPIEYNTSVHYIKDWVQDIHTLQLNNFTNNATHYDFYWYAIWIDGEGESQMIERKWLNRELNP